MADYLVTNTELTSIANAIRTKGGASSPLAFPTGFVSAIENIPSGGSPTLTFGAIRPDATVWKSWTGDYLLIADDNWVKPAYTTSVTTIKSETALETVTFDFNNYFYFFTGTTFIYPIYNTATIDAGRWEFTAYIRWYEIKPKINFCSLGGTGSSSINSVATTNDSSTVTLSIGKWTSSTTFKVDSGVFGICGYNPAITYTANSTSAVVKLNAMTIRGGNTYFTQTYWDAMTDARVQYKIRLWRIPKGSLNEDGWMTYQMQKQIDNIVRSSSHDIP